MSIAIDIVLCLIALAVIIRHTVRGFVRSMFGALKLIVAVFFTYVATPQVFSPQDFQTKLVAYLLVFSASYIVLTVIAYLVDRLCSLPLLNALNKLLGFALGIVCAYIALCVASAAIALLLNYAGEDLFGQTNEAIIESTYIYRYFNNSNFFPLIGK